MNAFLEIPALPPRTIVLNPPLSDEEFERMSEQCDLGSLERSKEGTIIVNAPAGGMTSDGNREIIYQLSNWWKQHRQGRAFDCNCGFFLPDGSCLSPDAAYVTAEQLQGLSREELAHYLRLAPAFVIELRSPSDTVAAIAGKMGAWIENGVQLGWMIDPYAKEMHVYTRGAAPRVETGSTVAGFGPVDGFVLDFEEIWRCYE
jgi:Uma2 family endonuclease